MDFGGRLDPEQMDAMLGDSRDRVRRSAGEIPLFAPAGWTGPVSIGEWLWHGGPHTLAFGDPVDGPSLLVQVDAGDPRDRVHAFHRAAAMAALDEAAAIDALESVLTQPLRASDGIAEITVESTPVLFELWEDGERWCAAGTYRGTAIALAGSGMPVGDIRLERVHDIEPYLRGHAEWLGRQRGSGAPD